jgi:hypothetical protein
MTTPAARNGRSVVPLSLALLVFNAFVDQGDRRRAPTAEAHAGLRCPPADGGEDPRVQRP